MGLTCMPGTPQDIPDDLLLALRRLQAERPGTWHEVVAEAVTAIGGTDSADLLAMAADRAASGMSQVGRGEDEDGNDPEQALAAMEEELRAAPARDPEAPGPTLADMDLLAHLPPVTPPRNRTPRSMEN